MKKNQIVGIILIFAFSILSFLGCTTLSKKEALPKNTGLLEPSPNLRFADIPVPMKFKFLPEDSYAFENAGVRVGILKYQGKANIQQVINFYKEQMELYNWNLLNVTEYGERLLNFERDNETCIISLLPKGSSVHIVVTLGPKSPISTKKPKAPIK